MHYTVVLDLLIICFTDSLECKFEAAILCMEVHDQSVILTSNDSERVQLCVFPRLARVRTWDIFILLPLSYSPSPVMGISSCNRSIPSRGGFLSGFWVHQMLAVKSC